MDFSSNYWIRFLDVIRGEFPKPTPEQIPLIVSVCYFATFIVFARFLRGLCNTWCPTKYREYAADFVTTFEICACSLENGNIRRHYGNLAYILDLILLGIWFSLTIGNSCGNPCGLIIKYTKGDLTLQKTCARILIQTCGGLLSFRFARQFWALGFQDAHVQRYASLHCTSDLTVTSPVGFGIEFAATVFESWLSLNVFTQFHTAEVLTKIISGAVLVASGVHLTGMYMNPVNASNQTFGCHGTSIVDHLLVYWVAPFTAAAFTVILQRKLRAFHKDFRHKLTNEHADAQKSGVAPKTQSPANLQSHKKLQNQNGSNGSTATESRKNLRAKKKKVPTATLR